MYKYRYRVIPIQLNGYTLLSHTLNIYPKIKYRVNKGYTLRVNVSSITHQRVKYKKNKKKIKNKIKK